MDDAPTVRLGGRELAAWLLGLAVLQLGTLAAFWTGEGPALRTLDTVAAVAGLALAPLVLRRPVPVGVALGVLAAVSPAATASATTAAFAVAQLRPARTATLVCGVGVVGQLVVGAWRPTHQLGYGWWVLFVVIAYATLLGWGRYLRTRRRLVASLRAEVRRAADEAEAHARRAREDERRRIAREMHDVLAHRLSLVATYAGALEYRPDAPREDVARAAGVVRAGLERSLEELAGVIAVLRDPDRPGGEDDGAGRDPVTAAPQPTLRDLSDLVDETRAAGTPVTVRVDGLTEEVPETLGRTVFRVVQEALTNARKHAPGRPVDIALEVGAGRLDVVVRNPLPTGGDAPAPGTRSGLVGLAERLDLAGGGLTAGPVGADFVLRAWLAWPG